jgi:hypothetical protein
LAGNGTDKRSYELSAAVANFRLRWTYPAVVEISAATDGESGFGLHRIR